jgi:hypothetical protein
MLDIMGVRITERIQDVFDWLATHTVHWRDCLHVLAQACEIITATGTVIVTAFTVLLYLQNKPPTASLVPIDSALDAGVVK